MQTFEVGQEVDLVIDAKKWTHRVFGSNDPGCEGMRLAGVVEEVGEDAFCVQPPGTERFTPFAIWARYDEVIGD